MSTENTQVQQKEDGGKIARQFENNMKKLVALMNGRDQIVAHPKLDNDSVITAMQELTKENKKKLVDELKTKINSLVTSYVEFDNFTKQKQREMEKAIQDKKKEFNKQAEEAFKLVEKIETIERTYYESLRQAMQPSTSEQPSNTSTEETSTEESKSTE